MSRPDRLLFTCPSCSAWPMPVTVRPPRWGGDERRLSFKCFRCGHSEGNGLGHKSRFSSPPDPSERGRARAVPKDENFPN